MDRQKVEQMQMIEQNLQHIIVQKQSVQSELMEINTALEQIASSDEVYTTIGNIMVKKTSEELSKELTEKKETLGVRLTAIENQEKKLEVKKTEIQTALMQEMKEGEKDE